MKYENTLGNEYNTLPGKSLSLSYSSVLSCSSSASDITIPDRRSWGCRAIWTARGLWCAIHAWTEPSWVAYGPLMMHSLVWTHSPGPAFALSPRDFRSDESEESSSTDRFLFETLDPRGRAAGTPAWVEAFNSQKDQEGKRIREPSFAEDASFRGAGLILG